MTMSDKDVNLLKMDMQITAKRLKLKDKNMNLSKVSSKIPKSAKKSQTFTIPTGRLDKNQENIPQKGKLSVKKSSKKKTFIRRPVDYTWNRGGRLKEIRIRTQARKFLYIWIRKTFGKMTYTQARSYHHQLLIRKCFSMWKGVWWDNCGEMKLWIRAEYFHRYRIYSKVWLAWKDFNNFQKRRKYQMEVASKHYAVVACKKHISLWKLYIQLRRVKKNLYNKAYEISRINLTSKTWSMWCGALRQKYENDRNVEKATLHWTDTMQRKTWTMWVLQYNESIKSHHNCVLAQQRHRVVIMRQHLSTWCQYVVERRRKHLLYRTAQSLYELSLKHRMVKSWLNRYQEVMLFHARMRTCEILSIRSTKRRYLLTWIRHIEYINIDRRKQAIADIHHRKYLLRKVMLSLKLSICARHKKSRMLYTAVHFYADSLIKNSWIKWQSRMEKIEDGELQQLSQIATEHYRYVMMQKAFKVLMSYREGRRHRRQDVIKAEAHFIVKALPRCFNCWRNFVKDVKVVNEMRREACNFRKDVLTTKYFYVWWSNFEQARDTRTMDRMALMQYNENALRSHFHIWSVKTREILASNRKDAIARVHYRKSLLKLAVKSWITYTKTTIAKLKKSNHASSYRHSSLLAGAWLSWRQYISRCHGKQHKIQIASNHFKCSITKKCLESWKSQCQQAKVVRNECERRFEIKRRETLRLIICSWRRFSIDSAEKKHAKEMATRHRALHIKTTVLNSWREWSALHCHRRQMNNEKVDEAVNILNRLKLRRLFHHWRETKDVFRREHVEMSNACEHYRSKICKVVFQAWTLYRFMRLKKLLMKRQANIFCESRIIRNYFDKWKVMLELKADEEVKTGDALWHWAVTLQNRCFGTWLTYTTQRKHKNQRYDDAMDHRRGVMLKKGCTQMLRYHSDMLARRTKLAASRQAQMRYTAYHLAWKYGKIWVSRVRQRIRSAEKSKPSASFRQPDWSPNEIEIKPQTKSWIAPPLPYIGNSIPQTSRNLERDVSPKLRPAPRLPEFLDESLQREGLLIGDFRRKPSEEPISIPQASKSTPVEELIANTSDTSCSQPTSLSCLHVPTSVIKTPCLRNDFVTSQISPPHREPSLGQLIRSGVNHSPTYTTSQPSNPTQPEPFVVRNGANHSPPYTTSQPSTVLLPPSAFTLPACDEPHINHENGAGDGGFQDSGVGSCPEEPKSTFKTFVASPNRDRDELTLIYAKLQEFQQMKQQLKVLKQQKDVLERWINENISNLQPNSSLDMVAVQDELNQINKESDEISCELLRRKPQVENLALRVRVLCSRPT